MNSKEENYTKEKEEDTMAALTKPTNKAFVLNPKKSEAFLKQDNSQFKNVMAKFEKFTKKESRGTSKR
ncbi:hypothetical protein [Acetivibrio ethanolgignens]|uniref:Uncharacterized protein n=1 Tax=Acetivibrio ethanolgignens TaxID=290052 RepID=A0A0V8QE47_9FIRM|nr:hypothetical protein [Acetivibrio ethanolgignens]KSV58823.1 hypothetical protein ASU35_11610 [Acetivibrio ethanolgignens]